MHYRSLLQKVDLKVAFVKNSPVIILITFKQTIVSIWMPFYLGSVASKRRMENIKSSRTGENGGKYQKKGKHQKKGPSSCLFRPSGWLQNVKGEKD